MQKVAAFSNCGAVYQIVHSPSMLRRCRRCIIHSTPKYSLENTDLAAYTGAQLQHISAKMPSVNCKPKDSQLMNEAALTVLSYLAVQLVHEMLVSKADGHEYIHVRDLGQSETRRLVQSPTERAHMRDKQRVWRNAPQNSSTARPFQLWHAVVPEHQ